MKKILTLIEIALLCALAVMAVFPLVNNASAETLEIRNIQVGDDLSDVDIFCDVTKWPDIGGDELLIIETAKYKIIAFGNESIEVFNKENGMFFATYWYGNLLNDGKILGIPDFGIVTFIDNSVSNNGFLTANLPILEPEPTPDPTSPLDDVNGFLSSEGIFGLSIGAIIILILLLKRR